MEITSLCLLMSFIFEPSAATLSINPNKSQFFWYDTITLRCEEAGNSENWTLCRNTSSQVSKPCSSGWGIHKGPTCTIEAVYPSDSGVYWCESERGERSSSLNITITDNVILDGPALPVTEGDRVTLVCYYKQNDSSNATLNFSANFYKDGSYIGSQLSGNMTFTAVSTSDEGFYRCEYPGKGESPQAWIAVRSKNVKTQPPPLISKPRLLCTILLFVLYTILLIVCVKIHRLSAKAQAEAKRASDHLSRGDEPYFLQNEDRNNQLL